MNWLLTYCDGSSGYKTAQLLSHVGAKRLLLSQGFEDGQAERALANRGQTALLVSEGEEVLYPVPDVAEDDVEDEDCEEDD